MNLAIRSCLFSKILHLFQDPFCSPRFVAFHINLRICTRLCRRPRTNTHTHTHTHTHTKRCSFHHRGLECKIGSQEIPGVTGKFGPQVQNEAGQRLTEFCQENALAIANTFFQQHRDSSIHGYYQMVNMKSGWLYSLQLKMEKIYRISKKKKKKSTTTTKKTLGGYCGSDHELLQNSLKLKKVGKTTRPLKYDLSQIPFNYTVEVTNRLKGLDLID